MLASLREFHSRFTETLPRSRYNRDKMAIKYLKCLARGAYDDRANMFHVLREPLNDIIGFFPVILDPLRGIDDPVSEQQRSDLEIVHANGQRLLDLINDLLDVAEVAWRTPEQDHPAGDERDRDLLMAVVSQAAIAIQNAPLFEQTQSRAEWERRAHHHRQDPPGHGHGGHPTYRAARTEPDVGCPRDGCAPGYAGAVQSSLRQIHPGGGLS